MSIKLLQVTLESIVISIEDLFIYVQSIIALESVLLFIKLLSLAAKSGTVIQYTLPVVSSRLALELLITFIELRIAKPFQIAIRVGITAFDTVAVCIGIKSWEDRTTVIVLYLLKYIPSPFDAMPKTRSSRSRAQRRARHAWVPYPRHRPTTRSCFYEYVPNNSWDAPLSEDPGYIDVSAELGRTPASTFPNGTMSEPFSSGRYRVVVGSSYGEPQRPAHSSSHGYQQIVQLRHPPIVLSCLQPPVPVGVVEGQSVVLVQQSRATNLPPRAVGFQRDQDTQYYAPSGQDSPWAQPAAIQTIGFGHLAPHPNGYCGSRREIFSTQPHLYSGLGAGPFNSPHPGNRGATGFAGQSPDHDHVQAHEDLGSLSSTSSDASKNLSHPFQPPKLSAESSHNFPRRSRRTVSCPQEVATKSNGVSNSIYWGGSEEDNEFLLSSTTFFALEAGKVLEGVRPQFDDIRSVPLVVELPKEGKTISDSSMKGAPPPQSRWPELSAIYVIMPSRFQVGVARTLSIPHGHFPLVDLLPALLEFSSHPSAGGLVVNFIGASSNFSNVNISIRNDVCDLPLPWSEISEGLSKLPRPSSVDTLRQRVSVDIGFAGTKCVGRNAQCDLGLSAPRMLVTSRNSPYSRNFFDKTHIVDEAVAGLLAAQGKKPSDDRVKRWGARLGTRNTKEAVRLHETDWSPAGASICSFHNDTQNGDISEVSFCNRVYVTTDGNWKRQGAVLYYRRSIDNYESRRVSHGAYLEGLRSILLDELSDRLTQCTDVVTATDQFEIAEGLNAKRIPCSCEVESYYQPFVACCYRLVRKFSLNELQLTSCLLAMSQSLCTASYALAATEIALTHSQDIDCDVGYAVLNIIKNLDDSNPKKIKLALRFSKYMNFNSESERSWLRRVTVCLRAMKEVRGKPSAPTQADYNGCHRIIMANLEGVADLRSNHLMGLCSILGLIPLCMFGMIDGGARKAYLKVRKLYGKGVPSNADTLENVQHLIETVVGRRVTKRYTENTFCKLGRVLAKSDKKYCDIIDTRFPLLVVKGNRVKLFTKTTEEVVDSIFNINNGEVVPNIEYMVKTKREKRWMVGMLRR